MLKSYVIAAIRRARNAARTVLYKGDTVTCLICKWEGSRFFEQGRCPKCGSLPRTRFLAYSLAYFGLDLGGASVLHVAPNKNEFSFISKNYFPAKYDRLNLYKSAPFINLVGDLRHLHVQDESYDYFIAWHVFEHIEEDEKAISEVYRLLKPGGYAIVSVPIHPPGNPVTFEDHSIPREKYADYYGHPDHCRSCGEDYFIRFTRIGFECRTLRVRDGVADAEKMKFGLSDKHVCWLFRKPAR